ncbi:MAG TPA: tetratricopeptide repeat protein [Thermoanaerobaculia bacterium]|nr:tetratricopeptide repeat protein [Thermoanaerobaculia bacterium]
MKRLDRRGRLRVLARLLPAVSGLVFLALRAAPAAAQDSLSPLPPPVTRGLYRSNWFDFLSAFSENDPKAEDKALEAMVRAGRKVGVRHLSDFSRTAVFLGRKAEKLGQPDRAARAYAAALRLDESNPDAILARLSYLGRQRRFAELVKALPDATADLLSVHETRVALLSSAGLWAAAAVLLTLAATILSLAVRHGPQALHDVGETAFRSFGPSAALPLGLLIAGVPLFFGFGPLWLVLYWGALLWSYADGRERFVLGAGFVGLALVVPLCAWIAEENIRERSPLFVAAIDLEERREDASAEDGLKQAAAVFPEDADVWFLLGTYAERAGDLERALEDYGRAVRADPSDYRPSLSRGNVHFTEGDYGEAVRDYIEATKKAPRAADALYNLALARGEAYDFDGQAQAMAQARALSASQVAAWSSTPTLARVVSPGYSVAQARARIADWNAQPKSRRLPGHGTAARPWRALISPWALGPLAVLGLGVLIARVRRRRGVATLCERCGRVFCNRCRRYGDPPDLCTMCARMMRREVPDIEVQAAEASGAQRRAVRRARWSRIASLVLPGSHAFGEGRPVAGAITLFLFFFGAAAAVLDERFFDPRTLAPEGARAAVVAGLILALMVWLRAQLVGRRAPGGS